MSLFTIFALFHTISLFTPLIHSTSTLTPILPTPIPSSPILCPDNPRSNCLQLYANNVSMFSDSNFSVIFTEFCEISQPASSLLCNYTRDLVSCVTDRVSQLILAGTNSRNLDFEAKDIFQNCSADFVSTLPTDEVIVSDFARVVNEIHFYGYFINHGIFSSENFNVSNTILREINSLCVSRSANSSIINANALNDYITSLNVSNLNGISCTNFCPFCETLLIGSSNDAIIPIEQLCSAISNTSLVSNCLCGDSRISIAEMCDDGNRENSDGCTNTCGIETNWDCIENANGLSECSNCGNNMLEIREECDHSFGGCDSNTCTVSPLYNCRIQDQIIGITNCEQVLLDTNTSDPLSVDSVYSTSSEIFRLDMSLVNVGEINSTVDYRLIFSRLDNPEIPSDSNPVSLNIEGLTQSLGIEVLSIQPTFTSTNNSDFFNQTYSIDSTFLMNFKGNSDFRSCLLAFINFTQVDLSNRPAGSRVRVEIQIRVTDIESTAVSIPFGSASITITSLGVDANRPVITLPEYTAIFYEGNDSIPIVSPLSTITDPEDMFYPIQSMTIALTFIGQSDFGFESLSVVSLPNNFNITYDMSTNELMIIGPGLGSEYTSILNSVIYRNLEPEPTTGSRRIFITVMDTVGATTDDTRFIQVMNINDLPVLTFSRGEVTYGENDPPIVLDNALNITDMDVNPSIQSAYVILAAIDSDEVLLFGAAQNIFAVNNTFLVINTSQPLENVRDIFREVSYQHFSDNPTSGVRIVTFSLTDDNNGTIFTPFSVTVQLVNDAPVVEISHDFFTYFEGGTPVLYGDSITLSDVDSSNFSRVEITIFNIPFESRNQEVLTFMANPNIMLQSFPGIRDGVYIYIYRLIRNTPITDYQLSISSVQYSNTFSDDFMVIEGNRTVEITAMDIEGEISQPVRLTIEITRQNDAPILNLGDGLGQNWTFSFTEYNSSSLDDPSNEEHIVLLPSVDIFDEENDRISKLTIQLAISNGQLDPNEFIFVRSPLLPLFDNSSLNIIWYTTGTYMEFNGEASALNYTNILKGIFYTNDENEPSLYPFGDRFLRFEVIDILGDSSVLYTIIETIPINDNRPVLLLRLRPSESNITRERRETPDLLTFKPVNVSAFLERKFVSDFDTLESGDVIHVVFENAMKMRNLARQDQINSLLSFNLDVPNEVPKLSEWINAKTLAISFPRIDGKFKDRLSPLKHTNLSIIFKDCTIFRKKCIHVCANKKQLTCAKGEIGVKIIEIRKEAIKPSDEVEVDFSIWYIGCFFTFLMFFAIILILMIYFYAKSSDKKRKHNYVSQNNVTKNGLKKDGTRKTDEEQINPVKSRKYHSRKPKNNPRSTPNIFKQMSGEN